MVRGLHCPGPSVVLIRMTSFAGFSGSWASCAVPAKKNWPPPPSSLDPEKLGVSAGAAVSIGASFPSQAAPKHTIAAQTGTAVVVLSACIGLLLEAVGTSYSRRRL